jgi:hypothetical protein
MNWEVDNNNFGGLRIPGVFATPTQGGFQSFASPEDGLTAIAHQLDRYFSGKTTGKPLNTLNQIINTWAPPSDNNPTNALIQRASQIVGVSPDAPLDFSNPDTRAKLIEATVRNEQGGKLPVDPSIIQKVAASYTPGAAAPPSGNNKMLPAFGNTRALAQLTPSVEQTGGLPMDDPSAAAPQASGASLSPAALAAAYGGGGGLPANVAATGGLYNAPTAGASDPNDITAMLPKLMAQAKAMGLVNNPSQTLANMAAGFLGGRGPAQSLAGGFAGLAKSQGQDQSEGMSLMKMALMYGPVMQQQIEQKKLANAAAMTRTGAVGMGTALKLNGLDPEKYGGADEKTLNEQTFSDKPLPASTQKQVDQNLQSISTVREQKAILTSLQDEVKNGTFKPDALHMKFLYPAQAAAGNPLGDPGVVAWQKWNAASHALSNEILRGNAGVQTDADAKHAMDILTGGGITSPDQFNQHVNFLTNRGVLAEQKNRFLVDNTYKNAKKGKFDWDSFEQTLPGSPSVATPKDIGQNPYGDLNVGRPTAASVGNGSQTGALPTATGPNGQKVVFQNGQWVPSQ